MRSNLLVLQLFSVIKYFNAIQLMKIMYNFIKWVGRVVFCYKIT